MDSVTSWDASRPVVPGVPWLAEHEEARTMGVRQIAWHLVPQAIPRRRVDSRSIEPLGLRCLGGEWATVVKRGVVVIPALAVEEQFGMAGEEIADYAWRCVFEKSPLGDDCLRISGGTCGHLLNNRVLVGRRRLIEQRQRVRGVDSSLAAFSAMSRRTCRAGLPSSTGSRAWTVAYLSRNSARTPAKLAEPGCREGNPSRTMPVQPAMRPVASSSPRRIRDAGVRRETRACRWARRSDQGFPVVARVGCESSTSRAGHPIADWLSHFGIRRQGLQWVSPDDWWRSGWRGTEPDPHHQLAGWRPKPSSVRRDLHRRTAGAARAWSELTRS